MTGDQTQILDALKTLRRSAKVIEKRLLDSGLISPDEMADFVNAIITANSCFVLANTLPGVTDDR